MIRFEASDDVGVFCSVDYCDRIDRQKEEIFVMGCQHTPAVNIGLSRISNRAVVPRLRREFSFFHSRFLYVNFVTDSQV